MHMTQSNTRTKKPSEEQTSESSVRAKPPNSTSKQPSTTSAKPSATREKILDFIQQFIAERNYSPSMREIASAVGLSSPATIHRHIGILESEGKLLRAKNLKRALMVTKASSAAPATSPATTTSHSADELPHGEPWLEEAQLIDLRSYQQSARLVPLVGHIAAGQGTIAEENIEDTMAIPADICGSGDLFVLRVRGDSMTEAAILDGDYVVARQQTTASNGDIVVAGINQDEATVKRFRLSGSPLGSTITLLPENESYSPMELPAGEVAIYGKVVSVLRRL